MLTRTDLIINMSLIVWIVVCIVILVQISCKRTEEAEHFSSSSNNQLSQYGIADLAEARQIVDGTWNEVWDDVPQHTTTILYYSVFDSRSRGNLLTSPFTWTNVSPVFAQKLPENCKIDDSKLVFTRKPFDDTTIPGIYVRGIGLNNNKGNGPLAMNTGLNIHSLEPQKFSLMFLLRFNPIEQTTSSIELLNMKANTANNNGIRLTLDINNSNNIPDHYRINVRVNIGGSTNPMLLDTTNNGGINISATQNAYYMLGLTRNGHQFTLHLYSIDILLVEPPLLLQTQSFQYTENIQFSNVPIQLSGGINVVNLMAIAIAQNAFGSSDIDQMAVYWRKVLIKTGTVVYALCQQALSLSACPFEDKNVCQECSSISDWRQTNLLLTAPTSCRIAYDKMCSSSNMVQGCECYRYENNTNQECTTWKSIMKGVSVCTQVELDTYMKNNCSSNNSIPDQSKTQKLEKIRDYIQEEEYDVLARPTQYEHKGFWKWLFSG